MEYGATSNIVRLATDRTLQHGWQGTRNSLLGSEHKILWRLWRGKEVWPALATAIIVAITRNNGEEILLVQSNKFKKDYLGLVAGFVETGETLEECLRREVWEETHLHVTNIRYFASQPWPYPSGLMVGFTADYADGELKLQRSELNKGGWYKRSNLPAIPGKVSLARQLIDNWYYNELKM